MINFRLDRISITPPSMQGVDRAGLLTPAKTEGPVPVNSGAAAQIAQTRLDKLDASGPVPERFAGGVQRFKSMGIVTVDDLQRALAGNPWQFFEPDMAELLVLIKTSIEVHVCHPCPQVDDHVRRTHMPELKVTRFLSGRFEAQKPTPPKPDPTIVQLEGVVRGANIIAVDRSSLGEARRVEIPVDTMQAGIEKGELAFVLSDKAMADLGLAPGAAYDFVQEKNGRASEPKLAINNEGCTANAKVPTPAGLENAQWIGFNEVPPKGLPIFALAPDRCGSHIDVRNLTGCFNAAHHDVVVKPKPAHGHAFRVAEPRAVVGMLNLSTGATTFTSPTGGPATWNRIDEKGEFSLRLGAGDRREAMVMVVADHSSDRCAAMQRLRKDPGAPASAGLAGTGSIRLVAFPAGDPEAAVIVQNPFLGVQGKPSLSLRRLGFSDPAHGGGHAGNMDGAHGEHEHATHGGNGALGVLKGYQAATPGSLVQIFNQESKQTFTTVALQDGSFELPAELKLDDIVRLRVTNPFECLKSKEDAAPRCETEVMLQVVTMEHGHHGHLHPHPGGDVIPLGDSGLGVKVMGTASEAVTLQGQAVSATGNIDTVTSSEPEAKPFSGKLAGFQVTGDYGLALTVEQSYAHAGGASALHNASSFTVDQATHTISVTLDVCEQGGWIEKLPEAKTRSTLITAPPPTELALHPASVLGENSRGSDLPYYRKEADWKLEIHRPDGRPFASATLHVENTSTKYHNGRVVYTLREVHQADGANPVQVA